MRTDSLFPVAILAGGLATRLRPLTERIPKALLEVAGRPFIEHQLELLAERGVSQVVICTGYLGEMIREHVGDGRNFGLHVDYSFDGERLMGTAGALRKALPKLGRNFLVLYGDSYLPCDFRACQTKFTQSGRQALMTVYRNEERWDASNVEFADGEIRRYDKKNKTPQMRHIDYGLGVLSADAFALVPEDEPSDLAVLYQHLLARGQLAALEILERFYEIGSFQGLEDLNRLLQDEVEGDKHAVH